MKMIQWIKNNVLMVLLLTITTLSYAGSPVWTLTPLTATTLSVASNDTATVQYTVTNQSSRIHTLSMQSIAGITQLTTGLGICGNPFILRGHASCTLSLQVNGSQLTSPINDGPIVCEQSSSSQCYRPASSDILHITQASAITDATITVTGSPLTLTTNGSTGTLTINNTSLIVAATNITSESGNTCYNDWFLPAGGNNSSTGQLNCLFMNKTAIGGFNSAAYWGSTEINSSSAWFESFSGGGQGSSLKNSQDYFRCVRTFTP